MRSTGRGVAAAAVVLWATVDIAADAAAGIGDPLTGGIGSPVSCQQHPTTPGCDVKAKKPGKPGAQPISDRRGGKGKARVCRDVNGRVVPCVDPVHGTMGGDGCYYRADPGFQPPPGYVTGAKPGQKGTWYVLYCPGLVGPATGLRWLPTPPAGAAPPDPAVLAQQALRRLSLPELVIRVNPAPPTAQVVFVPTWLWVDAGSWRSRSATASAGGISVTATARAKTVVFATGDGARVRCTGPGTPWRAGMDPAAESPTCGHTYTAASPSSGYPMRATVTWEVSWVGGGESGTAGPLTTSAEVDLAVVEAGGVNTNGEPV